jgi:hypothetical protein
MSQFERIVTMSAAFDRRHSDPKKNYGIHGVDLRMVLKGPLGATQFLLYTGWHLPHVTEETWNNHAGDDYRLRLFTKPTPADKGYHWSTPQYEGQSPMKCDLMPSGECYYDGSSLNCEQTFEILLREGSEGVWKDLEEFYSNLCARSQDEGDK